jgi:hypothetical protein
MGTALSNLQSEIEQFNDYLPDWVYHRNKKNIAPIVSKKEKALKDKYIAPFHRELRHYFAVDIDHENWYEATHDTGLIPNIVISNKDNNKSHLLYKTNPIWLGKGSSDKLKSFHKAINKGLSKTLDADLGFNGQTIKNPNSDCWDVRTFTNKTHELNEISEYITLPRKFENGFIENPEGRNSSVFDSIRMYSYKIKSNHNDFNSFSFDVGEFAHYINNNFPEKLSFSEVQQIINSVSKWTWKNYNYSNGTRGRDAKIIARDGITDTKERQKLSAQSTNHHRTQQVKDRIETSVKELIKDGIEIKPKAVINHSGLSKNSVYRHLKEISKPLIEENDKQVKKALWVVEHQKKSRESWDLNQIIINMD